MTKTAIKKLNRFTTLPVLFDLLQRKKLTLLDPIVWDDRNDSKVILEYKNRKKLKGLFALCFSCGDETVHHWKTFSHGSSGCVIEFDAKKLFKLLKKYPNVRHKKVEYRKLLEVESGQKPVKLNEMPFIKRWPYRCEEEYRIIAKSTKRTTFFEIDITLDLIRKITISQHMPKTIYKSIQNYLKDLKGNPDSKINHSTLYENGRWIRAVTKGQTNLSS